MDRHCPTGWGIPLHLLHLQAFCEHSKVGLCRMPWTPLSSSLGLPTAHGAQNVRLWAEQSPGTSHTWPLATR